MGPVPVGGVLLRSRGSGFDVVRGQVGLLRLWVERDVGIEQRVVPGRCCQRQSARVGVARAVRLTIGPAVRLVRCFGVILGCGVALHLVLGLGVLRRGVLGLRILLLGEFGLRILLWRELGLRELGL